MFFQVDKIVFPFDEDEAVAAAPAAVAVAAAAVAVRRGRGHLQGAHVLGGQVRLQQIIPMQVKSKLKCLIILNKL